MSIKKWQIIAIAICLVLGTVLHFTYEFFNFNIIVGLISSVNESVWEHLKLLFFPMILISIIGYFVIGKKLCNYWFAQATGILVSLTFVVVFFYTYTGIIGDNFAILDISSFIIGILLGEYTIYKILKNNFLCSMEVPAIMVLIIILLCFFIFTIYPPIIPLFEDPIYGTFGTEPQRIE